MVQDVGMETKKTTDNMPTEKQMQLISTLVSEIQLIMASKQDVYSHAEYNGKLMLLDALSKPGTKKKASDVIELFFNLKWKEEHR